MAVKVNGVANIADLIDASNVRIYQRGVSTGFADLDECTGGFLPGALWLVLGTPGVGRTLLATQFALHTSVRGQVRTSLVLGRESSRSAVVNFYCQLGRVAAGRVQRGTQTPEETERLAAARDSLRDSSLSVWSRGDGLWPLNHREYFAAMHNAVAAGDGSDRVVIIDDYDDLDDFYLLTGRSRSIRIMDSLRNLRSSAVARESTVVVTMPEEEWLDGEQALPDLRRDADVILRIVQPDMFAPDSPRAGEADLLLLRNRTGPPQTCTVAFQGHFRRFADFDTA